jgi:alpha-mannosidase/mannosylglycerate hydrolase
VDAVHEDMMYRFHQSEQIARRLTIESTRQLTASVAGEPGENEIRVGVFNPLPRTLHEMIDLDLELPLQWPKSSNEMSNSEGRMAFRIFDAAGKELPYQLIHQQLNSNRWRVFYTAFAQGYKVNVVRVTLPLDLPALGYTTLTVRANQPGQTAAPIPLTTPGLATGERSMANQALNVTIENDGALSITDLRSGKTYSRLLTFEDCADVGDGWDHGPSLNDQYFYSTGSRTTVALAHNGRYRTTFRVRTWFELPAEFDFNRMARGEQMVGMLLDSLVTLRAGAERVEVETTVHNNVKDHRLRVLFPSGANARTYLADSPFDVVERPIALRADNHLYREAEIETKPQQTLTAVFDEERGLAVVSTGLHESAVIDLPERPLALTLFRATRKTVGTDGEPGGQVQGELRFRYWIQPLRGEPDRAELLSLGQLLSGGVETVSIDAQDVRRYRALQALPPLASFLELEGAAVLTSLRRGPAGLEARLFNPAVKPVHVTLKVNGWPEGMPRPKKAQPVDFERHPVGEAVAIVGGQASLNLGPKKILTVLLE